MQEGVKYTLNPISKEDYIKRLHYNIQCRNHLIRDNKIQGKSEEFINDKLSRGFLLLISLEKVTYILEAELYPVYIAK